VKQVREAPSPPASNAHPGELGAVASLAQIMKSMRSPATAGPPDVASTLMTRELVADRPKASV
jgi:hypothetical protein